MSSQQCNRRKRLNAHSIQIDLAVKSKQEIPSLGRAWHPTNAIPYYETRLGAAYLGDTLQLIKLVPDRSVNLIVTSPPFPLLRKKDYGNVSSEEYVPWFCPFADEFR